MELLEREPFLTEFDRLLAEAAAGQGRLVFVGGEAGVGKTALVRRVADSARKVARVLVGAYDPMSTPRPLGRCSTSREPWVERLSGSSETRASRVIDPASTAAVLRAFPHPPFNPTTTPRPSALRGPALRLARLLLVVTYQDDEVGPSHPLRVVLGDLATAAPVCRMSLPCLTEGAIRRLAEGSPTSIPWSFTAAPPGTPSSPPSARERLGGIPATVRDAVLARASRLSKAGRATLDAAAVIGAHGEAWLLAEVAGRDAPAVRDCVAAGMLRVEDDGFGFPATSSPARPSSRRCPPPGVRLGGGG